MIKLGKYSLFILIIGFANSEEKPFKINITGKVLNKNEVEQFKKEFNVLNDRQLPQISRFDPQALALCVRPGDICQFNRKSINSINSNYYRICV